MKMRIAGRELGYFSLGEGPAVVLVHAFPLDGRMWHDTAVGLRGKCRVIAPDMRGFGESELGPGQPAIADMADDVAALMDSLGLAKATVGGQSMGGYVALAFAARHRARLAGRSWPIPERARTAKRHGRREPRPWPWCTARASEAFVERQLASLLAPGASEEVRDRVRVLGRQSPEALRAAIGALRDRPDRRAELPSIDCPTLVIVGAQDQITVRQEMAEMAGAISGARLVEIPEAGHLSSLERPAEFIAALANFV